MPVRVVTDSTADLPPEIACELGITVVPLKVLFGEETYRESVDITPDRFFQMLREHPVHPTTTQPSVGDFLEAYERLAADADGILSIHISAKLSGTLGAAQAARAALPKPCPREGPEARAGWVEDEGPEARAGWVPVELVDSGTASMAMGLAVIKAARAAQAGASLAEATAVARDILGRFRLWAMLDTLEYIRRGGRIGRAQAFLGSVLQVKPIITVQDGEVYPVERVRTRSRALQRLAELALSFPAAEEFVVLDATTPEDSDWLEGQLRAAHPQVPVTRARLGAVLGTHCGPGAVGVVTLLAP